jgi:RNA polymerase sigma-70 factor (ECF subfamily)
LKHFLANERDFARAQKRGGGSFPASIDFTIHTAEDRYGLEPLDTLTPEKIFEKQWALEVLHQAMARLSEESVHSGKSPHFNRFKSYLTGDDAAIPYSQLARELAMTEGAVKVAIHRLRQRFHQALRDEISLTVIHPNEISDEIRHLIIAIRG